MLLNFQVTNFKAIRNQVCLFCEGLDEDVSGIPSIDTDVCGNDGSINACPTSLIWSLNCGGKTSFIEAINFMKHTILGYQPRWVFNHFCGIETKGEISAIFIENEQIYKYTLTCNPTTKTIESELGKIDTNTYLEDGNAANSTKTVTKEDYAVLNAWAKKIYIALDEDNNFTSSEVNSIYQQSRHKEQEQILNLLQVLDPTIQNVKWDYVRYQLIFSHGYDGYDADIPLSSENKSIQRFLKLLCTFFCAKETGGLVVIDDIDIYLHYAILEHFVRFFNASVKAEHPLQLIATTNSVYLLDSYSIRWDGIWFLEKIRNDTAMTSIIEYADYEKRRTWETLSSGYLIGRYGDCVPFIEDEFDIF